MKAEHNQTLKETNVPSKNRLEDEQSNRIFSEDHAKRREELIKNIKTNLNLGISRKEMEYMGYNMSDAVVSMLKNRIIEAGMEMFADVNKRFEAKYEMGEYIGEGTNAVVKKSLNKTTGKIYAVKIIRTNDVEELKAIKNEYLIQKSIEHPNIVQAYEMYYNPLMSNITIIMEYIEGQELFDIIQINKQIPGNFFILY